MADDTDLDAAKSGDKDLARRDLRNAHLEGLDLREVDLTGAHIERAYFNGADLSGATLREANTSNANMTGANLTGVIAPSSVFFSVDLTDANLSHAVLSRSHFSRVKLNGADLRNADFRSAHLNDGTDFSGCIVDETTIFDGAHILRPMARLDTFRFYEVDRGVLVRRKDGPRPPEALEGQAGQPQKQDDRREEVARRIRELLHAIAPLRPVAGPMDAPAGMGHNNPPEPTPLDRQEFDDLAATLSTLAVEIHRDDIKPEAISDGAEKIERVSSKVAGWVARKADLAADESAKQLGKSLGDARLWMAGWLVISGKLTVLAQLMMAIFPP